jgi:hypothetical protein
MAGEGGKLTGGVLAKHQHEMGGPNHACEDCHDGVKADVPDVLKGKYANMGGSNHECVDCHDDVKAPELPMPEGYASCAGAGGVSSN